MLVFLSWSGERSEAVAQKLSEWLPLVINAVDPWVSVEMEKGTRWSPEIADKLEKSRIGILCLTAENLQAPWLLFEAGAISKTKDAQVCTFLLGLRDSDVELPLGQFQHTKVVKDDVWRLVNTISKKVIAAGEKAPDEKTLEKSFKTWWPDLEGELRAINERGAPGAPRKREVAEVMEEMVKTVRGIEQRLDRLEIVMTTGAASIQPAIYAFPAGPGMLSSGVLAQLTRGGGILSPGVGLAEAAPVAALQNEGTTPVKRRKLGK